MLTHKEANAIWDILVEHAGAHVLNRDEFVYHQTTSETVEYRFMGSLGYGGKFWINNYEWYVNCYREDLNPFRQNSIDDTNVALKRLQQKFDAQESMNT